MRKIGVRAALTLLAFLVFSFNLCFAATTIDPSLKWKTIETPHFSIHYYPEIEDTARRLAPIAEEVNKTLTKALKYRLDRKTEVTLLDATDFGNGMTTVFPYPTITLYLTDLGGNLNPYKYDDYLFYLFTHEYTHALHLDMAEGGVSLFRAIFGRMMFPNAMEPTFMTEGIATYMESHYTNAGRGRDPRWQMMMRMEVLDDNLKSLDQAAVNTVKWPMGNLRYLYGVMFLDYLSETYGEAKLVSLVHVYGDFLFSIGIDGAFTFIYGKNLSMLWNEWLDYLQDKYRKQVSGLGKLTEPNLLTSGGYYHTKPKWSKDSRFIYYLQRNADDYPQIREVDTQGGTDDKLFEGRVFDDSLDLAPDGGRLIFTKADTYKNYYSFKDLFLLDLRTKRAIRLTDGERASDPAFSPDGSSIVFVKNKNGEKCLIEAGLGTNSLSQEKQLRALSSTTGEVKEQYYSPSYSPDGRSIVAAKHLSSGEQKIVLIDRTSGREEVLIPSDRSVSESNPEYSSDGQYILFDSDRTGIVNLYAYRLSAKRLYQITNVAGGAMMPDLSPDGKKIAYIAYSSNGYDLAVLQTDTSAWKEAGPQPGTVSTAEYHETSAVKYKIHDYDPLPSLMPTFWIPYSYYNENGSQNSIYIGGIDPLGQHTYYMNLGYDFAVQRPSYSLYYANNQFLPQITLGFSDAAFLYSWYGQDYWEREKNAYLLFSFFDNRVLKEYDRQVFSFGIQNYNLTNISTIGSFSVKPGLGDLNSLLLSWHYLSSRMYAASISPEDGIDLGMMIEMNSPALKSDYNFTNYSSSLKGYFKTPLNHHILASSLSGFYSKGDQLPQSNFSWRYLSMRGYPSTYFQGNKSLALSLEYRFPLWYLEKGLLYGYTFFDRVWGNLFFDYGGATFSHPEQLLFKRGIGAELNFDMSTFWDSAAFILKLGYAKGLDTGGEESVYLNIGI